MRDMNTRTLHFAADSFAQIRDKSLGSTQYQLYGTTVVSSYFGHTRLPPQPSESYFSVLIAKKERKNKRKEKRSTHPLWSLFSLKPFANKTKLVCPYVWMFFVSLFGKKKSHLTNTQFSICYAIQLLTCMQLPFFPLVTAGLQLKNRHRCFKSY